MKEVDCEPLEYHLRSNSGDSIAGKQRYHGEVDHRPWTYYCSKKAANKFNANCGIRLRRESATAKYLSTNRGDASAVK